LTFIIIIIIIMHVTDR